MDWYADPPIVRQFPLIYRILAAYCRVAVRRPSGRVPGGSFLQRLVIRAMRAAGADGIRPIETVPNGPVACLDLLDARAFWALGELRSAGPEHRAIEMSLRDGDTFIDLGANHGSFSLLALARVGREGAVHSFEPQPRLAMLLRQCVLENHADGWMVHELACSDRAGTRPLFVPEWQGGSANLFSPVAEHVPHQTVVVALSALDDVVDPAEVTGRLMLKIDVEGGELTALRGARRLLDAHHPRILIELNPTTAAAAGYSVRELLDALADAGYDRCVEMGDVLMPEPLQSVGTTTQRNVLVLHGTDGRWMHDAQTGRVGACE